MDSSVKYELFGRCIALHRDAEDSFYTIGKLVDQIPKAIDSENSDKYLELLVSIFMNLELLEKLTLSEYRECVNIAINNTGNEDQYRLQEPTSVVIADKTDTK